MFVGIAFIPVGVALLYFSEQVNEYIIDYTDCPRVGTNMTCADYLRNISTDNRELRDNCTCVINFTLPKDFSVSFLLSYLCLGHQGNTICFLWVRNRDFYS